MRRVSSNAVVSPRSASPAARAVRVRGGLGAGNALGRVSGLGALGVALLLGAVAPACAGANDHEVLPPVVLAMLETMPPTYDDGEQQIFQVTKEVRLHYRQPDDGERPKGKLEPYPRPPFHVADKSRITVRFTLSNLDPVKHDVELLVDPWNEFVRYRPGVSVVRDEEVLPNFSGIQRIFILPPQSRLEGIITPDDMVEAATDLTVAMSLAKRPPDPAGDFGGAVLYNRAFNVQNRSSEPDPVLAPWAAGPKSTVASVIGFDVGLRTAEPAKIALELVVDLEDLDGERIVIGDDPGKPLGPPGTVLSPPAGGPAQ